jgi:hypothetical protein
MRTHTIIRLLVAAVLAAGVLAVAACGEDDAGGATSGESEGESEARDAALEFAQCMREHGVDMPDPSSSGGRQTFRVGPGDATSPEELEEAQEACQKYMDKVEPPEMSEERQEEFRESALAHARCMREHGIENFPDPTFDENGGARLKLDPSTGIDPDDSEFKEAQKACEDTLPEGPSQTEAGETP